MNSMKAVLTTTLFSMGLCLTAQSQTVEGAPPGYQLDPGIVATHICDIYGIEPENCPAYWQICPILVAGNFVLHQKECPPLVPTVECPPPVVCPEPEPCPECEECDDRSWWNR